MGSFALPRQGPNRCIYPRPSGCGTSSKPYFLPPPIMIPLVSGRIYPPNGLRTDEIFVLQTEDKIREVC